MNDMSMKQLNSKQILIKKLYKSIITPRLIEEKMLTLIRQGKISKWFSGIGQEAISVGTTMALNSNDTIFTMHRNLGVFTTRNVKLKNLFGQIMGTELGFTKGRDRSFHFGLPEYHIIGMISHLAAMLPVACGTALSYKLKKQNRICVAFVGDGATSEGDFHEALNLAAVWQLPVIFLIENNGYGLSTPTHEQYACKKLSDRAIGYGIEGITIDGNNISKVYSTISKYAKIIRKTSKPILIEAETFRIRGHEEASGTKYVPSKLIEMWKKRDPIKNIENQVIDSHILTHTQIDQLKNKINKDIDDNLEIAFASKVLESSEKNEKNDVYKKSKFHLNISTKNNKKNIRYVDAIKQALYQSMDNDNLIIMMGQDVAEYGGVFKVSEGFYKKFGNERVRNTPIIESGILGAALGLALEGFKPIVEMQFADFVSCGFNQIINNIAKTHYRWGISINATIRMPTGGGVNAGPFHSQNLENIFAHIPGLKIVYPSTPYDAKGLLISAINDPNPVLFFEHKLLYRTEKEPVPEEMYSLDIGKAKIVNQGNDITVISYGLGVRWVKNLLTTLNEQNISVELIDLRSLVPWDQELVFNSIKKTNRALVIHEANQTSGFGAEIIATITEHMFEFLDAPVQRLASIDTPTPFGKHLEEDIFWPKSKIISSIKNIIEY